MIFGIFCGGFVGLLGAATFFLFRSMAGLSVARVAEPGSLAKHIESLESYYRSAGTPEGLIAAKIDAEIQDVMFAQHVRCAQENWQSNMLQTGRILRAKQCIMGALGFLFLSSFPYFLIHHARPPASTHAKAVSMTVPRSMILPPAGRESDP